MARSDKTRMIRMVIGYRLIDYRPPRTRGRLSECAVLCYGTISCAGNSARLGGNPLAPKSPQIIRTTVQSYRHGNEGGQRSEVPEGFNALLSTVIRKFMELAVPRTHRLY